MVPPPILFKKHVTAHSNMKYNVTYPLFILVLMYLVFFFNFSFTLNSGTLSAKRSSTFKLAILQDTKDMKSIGTSLKHRSLYVVIQIKLAVLHLDQHCETTYVWHAQCIRIIVCLCETSHGQFVLQLSMCRPVCNVSKHIFPTSSHN